jgi:hypothetical protein
MAIDIYEEYAVLTGQEADIAEKKEALKAQIIADLVARGSKNEERPFGIFSQVSRKTWIFPKKVLEFEKKANEEIKAKKDEVDALKEKAKSTEEATATETIGLMFKVVQF